MPPTSVDAEDSDADPLHAALNELEDLVRAQINTYERQQIERVCTADAAQAARPDAPEVGEPSLVTGTPKRKSKKRQKSVVLPLPEQASLF